jgi:phosphinothricin tripeptide acetyl hydrolase
MSEEIKIVRQMLAQMPDSSGKPIQEQRRQMDEAMAALLPPEGFSFNTAHAGGVPAEWIRYEGAPADRVIYYLHGGGYTMGSPATHQQMVAFMSRAAGVPVLSLDYRLAPEHPFPAAVEDGVAGYRWLIKQGVDPSKIVIAGDSAGGGLTAATLVALRDGGVPLPAAGVCISPWADLTGLSETYTTHAERDPMISIPGIKAMASLYLSGRDAKTPLASPVFADLTGLPPILIQVGSEEVLLGDALALDRKAKTCGVDSTLEVWPEMIHVWHFFSITLKEGRDAIDRIGEYVKNRIG